MAQQESKTNGEAKNTGGRKESPAKFFMNLLLSPVVGFKKLKSSRLTPEAFNAGVFYPLLAIASASTFMEMAYYPDRGLSSTLINAICTFISFFITYFAVFPIVRLTSGQECGEKIAGRYGKLSVSATMSTIVLYHILYTLCPFLEPLLFFAPVYTVYLIYKSLRGVRIPEQRTLSVTATVSLVEIFIPYLIELCFKAMLGNNQSI